MKYYQVINLKNNSQCIIKSIEAKEVNEYIETKKKITKYSPYLMSYIDEVNDDINENRAMLSSIYNSNKEIVLGAYIDNKLVGIATLYTLALRKKVYHRGELSIGVLPDYQHNGIGKALLQALIQCGKQANYYQLELDLFSDNINAYNLYKSFNFKQFSTNPTAFKMNNKYYNGIQMYLVLDNK